MFKYLLLVLLAKELYSWEHPSVEEHLQLSLEASASKPEPVPIHFTYGNFAQKLDHFDPTDSRRWLQRYFILQGTYKPGGPIFLIYGITPPSWFEYAKQFGAAYIILEQRYHGLSWATNDLSTENLKYLNSQQELADLANFISWLKNHNIKVVVFGDGDRGSIAAWLRLKYPHLVDGAVAVSAAFEFEIGNSDFYSAAAEALNSSSTECASGVEDAFKGLNILLRHQDGQKQIKELFKLCPTRDEPEISPDDIPQLNRNLAQIVSFFALYRNASVCTTMTNQTIGTPLDRLASFVRNLLDQVDVDCVPYKYVDMVNIFSNPEWIGGSRVYLYQKCAEYGNFQINDPSHVLGDFSYAYYNKLCTDVFGSDYNLVALTTTIANRRLDYGGKKINVTNVVFVQGSKDYLNRLGVVKDVNSKSPAILIEGEYGAAVMWSSKENDSAVLTEARKKIASNIETWLKE